MLVALLASSLLKLGGLCQPEQSAAPESAPAAAGDPAASAAGLAARWPLGETRRYVYSQQVVESSGAAESIDSAQERKGTMRLGVRLLALDLASVPKDLNAEFLSKLESEKPTAAFALTLDTLRFSAVRPDGTEFVFDSADPELSKADNPFAPSAVPLVGVTVVMAINAEGRIVAATGYEDFIVISSPTSRLAIQLIEPTSMGVKFAPAFGFHAAAARAEVGATWVQDRSVPYVPGIVLEVSDACTTEKIADGQASIAWKGTPRLRIPNPERLGTREIKRSEFSATTIWDLTRGALSRHDSVMFTEVELNAVNNEPGSTGIVRSRTESSLVAEE